MKKILPYRNYIITATIICVFIGLSLYLGSILNIWEDEICSIKSTDKDAYFAFIQALKFEGQPPVYFVLLNFWRKIDNGILFSRLFSLISILISAYVFIKLIEVHVSKVNKHAALILFLFNPIVVWATTEIRHYAFSILLSLMLMLFFTYGFLVENKKRKYRYLYYIIAFFSLYTFYYFSFLLLANGVFLLIKNRWKDFLIYCFYMAIILLPTIFMFAIIRDEIMMHDQTLFAPNTLVGRMREVFMGLQNYTFSMFLLPINETGKLIIKLLIIFFVVIGFLRFKAREYRLLFLKDDNLMSLITALSVIVILYISLLIIFPRLYFTDRYLVVLFPLLTLLTVKFIWDFMPNEWLKQILFFGMIVLFCAGNLYYYRIPVKKFDYIMAADYLNKNVKDSKPILFYRSVLQPIFKYYYKGNSKLYDLPDSSGYSTNFLDRVKTEHQFDSMLKKIGGNKFWLVADDQIQSKYSIDYNRPMLYNYMRKKGIILKDTIFYGRADKFYFRITEFQTDTSRWNDLSWREK